MLQIDIKTDLMNYLSCIIKDFEDFILFKKDLEIRLLLKVHYLFTVKQECTEGPCGCVWVAVSSHGVIVKKDEHVEEGDVAFYEDYILTHPDPNSKTTKFSKDCVEERVSLKEIVEIFRDKQLKGIPKIFFIQVQTSNVLHVLVMLSKSTNYIVIN